MNAVAAGALAGAAGTIALDLTTYLDMFVRGRAPSNMPADVIRRLAALIGLDALSVPDDEADEATKNRRQALGAIAGYKVGVATGMVYGGLRPFMRRVPLVCGAVLAGAVAMAAADVPAAKLGATDPSEWDAASWLSDIVPHAIYGLVTACVTEALLEER